MVDVRGHTRNGAWVRPHTRSAPSRSGGKTDPGAILLGIVAVLVILGGVGHLTQGGSTATPGTDFNYTRLSGSQDGACALLSYGQAHEFLATHPCAGLSRALYSADGTGGTAHVAVAWVHMPTSEEASALKDLVDIHGTGNITELTAGVRFTGENYDSRIDGNTVILAQAESAPGHSLTEEIVEQAAKDAITLTP